MSPSRAFWAGENPTRHPGYLEELRGQPGSSRRLRPGPTSLPQPIGSLAPRTPSRLGLGDVAAVVVVAEQMPSGSRAPRSAGRPHAPALRRDHPAATTRPGSAALCTSTCRSHDVTGFPAPTPRPHRPDRSAPRVFCSSSVDEQRSCQGRRRGGVIERGGAVVDSRWDVPGRATSYGAAILVKRLTTAATSSDRPRRRSGRPVRGPSGGCSTRARSSPLRGRGSVRRADVVTSPR